ncbi:Ech hydrogenase subunit F [Elusimicrobium minutum Pei191]|uniref:Ech hydrogenase subunit F n=1 Tax=Elusimicrobium minutum (strain Pei191) TaxID=445932 RepID=B2KDT4_ELUMP|nr:4Fe-4S binding protein [Elusimicrobium minutum]ACC98680.1 Ech hydrogenase subunit F [Elusimicrobium minutum Pei191]
MAHPLKALKEVINNLFTKHSTIEYPYKKIETAETYRARIKFTPENCIGCNICVRNCPANAIKITQINPQDKPQALEGGKVIPAKRKFKCVIDLGRCIYCAQCVESCPKKALYASTEFELAAFDKKDLQDEFKHPEEDINK